MPLSDNFEDLLTSEAIFENQEQIGPEEAVEREELECNLYENVNLRKPLQLGLFYDKLGQAFTSKLVFTKVALYPFFGVYLNVPGHMYAALTSILPMFWSLKFFWGFLSDSKPIFGRGRIYYMALGWLISVLAYTISLFIPYPEPYYQVANCTLDNTVVNNPDAPNAGMYYVAIMAVGVFGVGITDLASDALVVDYVKREPLKHRGRINIFAAMCNTFGGVLLLLVIGVLLNSPAYGGRFCSLNFTFRDILMILLCISVLGFFNSSFMTFETETKKIKVDLMETVHKFWSFMHYRVFQRCALLFILVPSLYNAKTSANVKIRKNWAKVEPFYGSMIGVAVALLVIVGMYVLQRWFLHVSWKKLYSYTKLMIVGVSVVVEGLTIFDWVRSQYFYFSEDLLTSVAQAACAFIMLQLAAEVSEKGLEALTFGMLMTNWTISACFSVIIGNIISAPFQVNDDDRYLRDSLEDRWAVFGSVLATSFVNILAIPFFVLLCPSDRSQVKSLKESLGKSKPQAQIYAATFCVGYMFIFVFNALIMFPQTQCYQILGGKGCKI